MSVLGMSVGIFYFSSVVSRLSRSMDEACDRVVATGGLAQGRAGGESSALAGSTSHPFSGPAQSNRRRTESTCSAGSWVGP